MYNIKIDNGNAMHIFQLVSFNNPFNDVVRDIILKGYSDNMVASGEGFYILNPFTIVFNDETMNEKYATFVRLFDISIDFIPE